MKVRIATAIVALLGCFSVQAVHADDIDVKSAQRLIQYRGSMVHGFMYPTVTHTKVEFDGTKKYVDGSFKHVFTFHGTWSDKSGYCTMNFHFDNNGKLTGTTNGARSWFFPPYTFSQLLLEITKEVLKSDDDLKNDPTFKKFIREGDAQKIMIYILNNAAGK